MSFRRAVYLAFAVSGAVYPLVNLGTWFSSEGTTPSVLFSLWFSGPAAPAISGDILISAIVLSVWMLAEVYVRKNWIALVALPATWGIGISCGLPLYLFLRTAPPR